MSESNVIRARFIPADQSLNSFVSARRVLDEAEEQKQKLIRDTRSGLARLLIKDRQAARRNARRLSSRMEAGVRAAAEIRNEQTYNRLVSDASHDCLQLALSIAREIVDDAIRTDSSILEGRVQKALQHLVDRRALKISLHPEDAAALSPSFLASLSPLQAEIIKSANLQRGDFVIETSSGRLELNIAEHLQSLEKQLLQTMAGACDES